MYHRLFALLFAFFTTFAFTAPAHAELTGDPAYGYSFDLPYGWRKIPQADIESASAILGIPTSQCRFVAGFEPASHRRSFEYPYILIQVVPSPGGQPITSVSESELRRAVNTITGITTDDVKKVLSPVASKSFGEIGSRSASYFTSPPGFQMDVTLSAQNLNIHDHAVALVGRDRSVLLHLYSTQSDFQSETELINKIGSSLALDPSQQVAYVPSFFDGSPTKALYIGGAIVGLILLVVIGPLLKAAFRPLPKSGERTGSPIPPTAFN